jgi:6-pyruvoyltetrahydropterin/6-carboxytetrahydropterin synthase
MQITKIFHFEAAHHLTDYHGKCERVHGHSYKLEITVEGPVQKNGMVIDFVILKNIVKKKVIEKLDHHDLNEILENPSSENLVQWIWDQLSPFEELILQEANHPNLSKAINKYLATPSEEMHIETFPVKLKKIRLWETKNSYATLEK